MELALLAVIVLAGTLLRLVHLGALPLGAAGSEEGTSWLVTAGQLRHWYPLLPSGITYWKGWPYTALAALFSLPGGLSTVSLRLPSALSGALSIPIGWAAARGVFARFRTSPLAAAAGSLLCAYLLAFSSWSVLMSRWGRFYEMGQMLFLAATALAVWGFSAPGRPARGSASAFGAVLFVAAATFHPGAILLLAPIAALALGVRFDRKQTRALALSLAACALWFAGVLFFWKAGHVQASSGYKDLELMVGLSFWKHIVLLTAVGFTAWIVIVRAAPGRRLASGLMAGLLVLLETVMLVAAGVNHVDTGALRGFATLALGHPGLMLLAYAGSVVLIVCAWRLPREARVAAALLWFMTLVPIALVGASTGNFVPRYLLFTFGPIAVVASVGLGLLADLVPGRLPRLAGTAALLALAAWLVAPAVGVAGSLRMTDTTVGAKWPPLLACSPTRAYALDLETPSRFVQQRLGPGDLVVSTARSIPEAVIGRMDYFFRIPDPSNSAYDETGGPFNILTGCPVLARPEQVLALCEEHQVFVIIDERALRLEQVRELKAALTARYGAPAYTDGKYADVFVMPRGCVGTPPPGPPGSEPR